MVGLVLGRPQAEPHLLTPPQGAAFPLTDLSCSVYAGQLHRESKLSLREGENKGNTLSGATGDEGEVNSFGDT